MAKTPILPNCEVPICFFLLNSTSQELKFCKIVQLLCFIFSRERKSEGTDRK